MKIEITKKQLRNWAQWAFILCFCTFALLGVIAVGSGAPFGIFSCKTPIVLARDANINALDKNWLVGLEYAGGFCERLGLMSSIIVQRDENGNRWGLPVCVERKMND